LSLPGDAKSIPYITACCLMTIVHISIIFFIIAAYLVYKGIIRIRDKDVVINEKINMKWWSIGLSVFATDVSLSYIINTSGLSFSKGLAVGSYGWTSVIVLIVVALYILPKYMRLEIQTLPEYLELRFSPYLRLLFAIIHILFIVLVALSFVYYSFGVLIINTFGLDPVWQIPILSFIGLFSGLFLFAGGLKMAIKFDMYIAALILVAGILVFSFALHAVGGFHSLAQHAQGKLNVLLPADDEYLPWTQVFFGGVWLLHLNYWAFFQPMTQKVVSAESLSEAQKGLLLTATLKLLVPFLFIIPGIVCFELYASQVSQPDDVFSVLLKNILPAVLSPFIVLAFGFTVVSSSYAYLHAVGMMFTNDIFARFIHPKTSESLKEKVYFITILTAVLCAIIMAPYIAHSLKVSVFVQVLRYAFLPGIIVLFLIGLFHARSYAIHAWLAIILSVVLYFSSHYFFPTWIPLHVLGTNTVAIAIITLIFIFILPSKKAITLLGNRDIRFERNLIVLIWSMFIITLVCAIYVIFSQ